MPQATGNEDIIDAIEKENHDDVADLMQVRHRLMCLIIWLAVNALRIFIEVFLILQTDPAAPAGKVASLQVSFVLPWLILNCVQTD